VSELQSIKDDAGLVIRYLPVLEEETAKVRPRRNKGTIRALDDVSLYEKGRAIAKQ
jgi:hypothetical protein